MIITTSMILLFNNAFTQKKETSYYYARLAKLSLVISVIICYENNYLQQIDKGVSLYGGIYNLTNITQSFQILILILSGIILVYNSYYTKGFINEESSEILTILNRKQTYGIVKFLGPGQANTSDINQITEYPLIIMLAICGASFLMCSGDLITLFISIELQSYALYILSTVHRESEQSTWGGLTYFLLGGLSSCFILLGSAILYINTGNISLENIYILTSIGDLTNIVNSDLALTPKYYLHISLILISVGILFKISAAPFHFWSPDVYDALPTTVTTYVAIIAKISLFVILLDLVYYINIDPIYLSWKNTLLISSLLSLIIGSILGLTQFRIKRVLAYSTISHLGFILLALCVNTTESIQGYLFYIISYSISNLNAFIILVGIGYYLYIYIANNDNKSNNINNLNTSKTSIDNINSNNMINIINNYNINGLNNNQTNNSNMKDINNSPIQLVNQLTGLHYINSYLCLSLTITLFSFIGIPPLIGFFAKQMVLSAALDNGYIFISIIAILTSVIGAVYYLNIVKTMYFFESKYSIHPLIKKYQSRYNYFGYYKGLATGEKEKENDKASGVNLYNKNLNHNKIVSPLPIISKHNTKSFSYYNLQDYYINSGICIIISILTLLISLFIFIPNESFNLVKILSILLFK